MQSLTLLSRLAAGTRRLVDNPVARKELRALARGRRAFVALTIYLLLMVALMVITYLTALDRRQPRSIGALADQGRVLFEGILTFQALFVVFLAPALTPASVVGERERQSLDLLRTTLLSAHRLLLGKLFVALAFVSLLVLSVAPLQSIAFVLGGVNLWQLVLSQAVLLASAAVFALIGLFFSCRLRSTRAAVSATLLTCLATVIILPMTLALASASQTLRPTFLVRQSEAILSTANLGGTLVNIMTDYSPLGPWLPAVGYLLLSAAAAHAIYALAWRSLDW